MQLLTNVPLLRKRHFSLRQLRMSSWRMKCIWFTPNYIFFCFLFACSPADTCACLLLKFCSSFSRGQGVFQEVSCVKFIQVSFKLFNYMQKVNRSWKDLLNNYYHNLDLKFDKRQTNGPPTYGQSVVSRGSFFYLEKVEYYCIGMHARIGFNVGKYENR